MNLMTQTRTLATLVLNLSALTFLYNKSRHLVPVLGRIMVLVVP